MLQNSELILEGSYVYLQKDVNYCQENFKLLQTLDNGNYHLHAEILSRIETGEFLKLFVRYELTSAFVPLQLRLEKSIGNRFAEEIFAIDPVEHELNYTFKSSQGTHEFKRPYNNAKHQLASPAFCTSILFTLNKKMNATGRTPVILVSSSNEWTYEKPPGDQLIFAEFRAREVKDFQLNNNHLSASHLCLYEHDSTSSENEVPVDVFVSKHHNIPYLMTHEDRKIVIKTLKL